MDPNSWRTIDEYLSKALDLDEADRPAFVAGIADERLRDEIESLLAADTASESFLSSAAVAFSAKFFDGEADPALDQTIGSYKVVGELGRGGMGAVYLAERADGKFEQMVAIKLLKRELNTVDIRRRFAKERRILAGLSHPNIARLLDAGSTDDGIPYLVMEYVDGVPIDQFCDGESLSVTRRLELFCTVCDTVAFAHSNLVVHRDLKPSNILVTAAGVPKLLDFGIAKLLSQDGDEGPHTVTQLGAMTPEYASPEQVSGGAITTSTDVYSLGIVLYELLTGTRPFTYEKGNVEELLRAVCLTEPPRPSVVKLVPDRGRSRTAGNRGAFSTRSTGRDRTLEGDLDNIVLKAVKKEPERRYSSAEQFSEDVRRHLAHLPVIARPDTLSYRAAKFFSRNRLATVAALLIFLSVVTGVAATVWQARAAEANRERAEKRFTEVRGLANALLNDIAPRIERLEGSTDARRALVNQSLKYLDSLALDESNDPSLQAELASAYEKVAVVQGDSRKPSLSDFRGAIASLEKAQAIRRQLRLSTPDDAANLRQLADNLRLIGTRRIYQNDADGGTRDGQEAVTIYAALAERFPGDIDIQRNYIETRVEDAASYVDLGKHKVAIPMLEAIKNDVVGLAAVHPADPETQRVHAKTLAYLGYSLSWDGRQDEAETEMTSAVEMTEGLASRFPNDSRYRQDLWKIYQTAAVIYEEIDDAKGYELTSKGRAVLETAIAADGADIQARHNLAIMISRLGLFAGNLGRTAEALGHLENALAVLLQLKARDPLNRGYDHDVSSLYTRVGTAKNKGGDQSGALAAFQQARLLLEEQLSRDGTNSRHTRNLAMVCRQLGDVHNRLLAKTSGDARSAHLVAARDNYRTALASWSTAQTQNALTDLDQPTIQETQTALTALEKLE